MLSLESLMVFCAYNGDDIQWFLDMLKPYESWPEAKLVYRFSY